MSIRLAHASDGAAVAGIYRPAVTDNATSFEVDAPDAAEMARRIDTTLERTPWLVFEQRGVVVGYAYAGRHRERAAYQWSVEVSAYVHEHARRAGIARRLYGALFDLLTLQEYRTALAGITLPNDASVGLHRALGFAPVGVFERVGYKFGRWHDTYWLARPLAPHSSDPPAPVPLVTLPRARVAAVLQAY